jgi:hypothetical protein
MPIQHPKSSPLGTLAKYVTDRAKIAKAIWKKDNRTKPRGIGLGYARRMWRARMNNPEPRAVNRQK